jgi:hypothetical protein
MLLATPFDQQQRVVYILTCNVELLMYGFSGSDFPIITIIDWAPLNPSPDALLFPEKEAKSVSSASQKVHLGTQTSAKPTLGVWGLAPKKAFFFL